MPKAFCFCLVALLTTNAIPAAAEANDQPVSATTTIAKHKLNGVLVSPSNRSALIDGQIIYEGEFIGDVEVTEISSAGILATVNEQSVRIGIGGSFDGTGTATHDDRIVEISRMTKPRRHNPAGLASLQILGIADRSKYSLDAALTHTVHPGETLSHIALRYRQPDRSLSETMHALHATNRHAFGSSIDVLQAGAVLEIPTALTTDAALAKAPNDNSSPERIEEREKGLPGGEEWYGPVASGESLSSIAAKLLPTDVSMNQMMISIFAANSHAFDGNINMLRAGSTIRIPHETDLRQQSPQTATAEVARQTRAWLENKAQMARLAPGHTTLVAALGTAVRELH